eukprot:8156855-Ditylum_brightwellii.AAC.1
MGKEHDNGNEVMGNNKSKCRHTELRRKEGNDTYTWETKRSKEVIKVKTRGRKINGGNRKI